MNNNMPSRQIKFRGKTLIDPKWVYGCFIYQGKTSFILVNRVSDNNSDSVKTIDFIDSSDSKEYLDYYEVDPKTVSQFTGLQDKSGKDIYEGDIVNKEYHNGTVSDLDVCVPVEMDIMSDSHGTLCGNWYGWTANLSSLIDIAEESHVIGDIWDGAGFEGPDYVRPGDE